MISFDVICCALLLSFSYAFSQTFTYSLKRLFIHLERIVTILLSIDKIVSIILFYLCSYLIFFSDLKSANLLLDDSFHVKVRPVLYVLYVLYCTVRTVLYSTPYNSTLLNSALLLSLPFTLL